MMMVRVGFNVLELPRVEELLEQPDTRAPATSIANKMVLNFIVGSFQIYDELI
jgi:hypothetical protein